MENPKVALSAIVIKQAVEQLQIENDRGGFTNRSPIVALSMQALNQGVEQLQLELQTVAGA